MSATKPWAYVHEFGNERVTAWEIKRQRDLIGGAPLGRTWWSPHRKGERKRVTHTYRRGAVPFFTYIDGRIPGEGDGGETLSHVLHKNAIARLEKTQLRFPNGETHDIRITHTEIEKTIPLTVGYSVVDVYCRFESDGYLAKKWGGEICFEVWHTHRAPRDKILGLREKRVPVVEVPVSKYHLYRNETNTTDELEERYVNYLVGRLGEYMTGKAISNPSSVEYMEEQVRNMEARIARDQKVAEAQAAEIKLLGSELGRIKNDMALAVEHNGSLTTKLASLSNTAGSYANTIARLGSDNQRLATANQSLLKNLKSRNLLLFAMGTSLAVCLAGMLHFSFIGRGAEDKYKTQSTANDQRLESSEKLPERTSALTESSSGKAVKHKLPSKKINKKKRPAKESVPDSTATSEPAAD